MTDPWLWINTHPRQALAVVLFVVIIAGALLAALLNNEPDQ